ncbi:MAG: hypothetical protein KatS3mg131_3972 [Candidatus Tectimicrobiota bacterium]|nr:MAG: hypothetical protein KatS3mg131_3972 [Candidatus Tectomicrobia bacterium]
MRRMSVAQARERFARMPFAAHLGIGSAEVAPQRAVVTLPYRQENANPGGVLHGGATASLLHLAGELAVWSDVDLAAPLVLGPVDVTIQYLSPVLGDELVATACVLRRGRDFFFVEVTVCTPQQRLVSKGLLSYRAADYTGRPRRLLSSPEYLAAPSPATATPLPWLDGPYMRKLRMTTLHQSPGRVRLCLPCWTPLTGAGETLHEGVLASLCDTAGTMAAWSLVRPQGARGATVGMQLSYPGVPAHEAVIADARVQYRSEELFFATVQAFTATSRQPVALGNVTYRLLEAPP